MKSMIQKNTNFQNFTFPYEVRKEYSKRVVYISMEFALDQSLKIYSGGLGFLAGSHMRSAYELKQNVVGVGMLWKYGYYDQERSTDNSMYVLFQQKAYNFLVDSGIRFVVPVNGHQVHVMAWYLDPKIFGTAPMFFLSTDLPENDHLSQTISHKLYDSNVETKIAQGIVLGIGAGKLMDAINHTADIYHLNEAHGLPIAFYLYGKYKDANQVRKKMVFTTHTPVPAGNEKHPFTQLYDLSYFHTLSAEEVRNFTGIQGDIFEHTLAALRVSKIANGVSQIHGAVAQNMWGHYTEIPQIIAITNAQQKKFWVDPILDQALAEKDTQLLRSRKLELKKNLFIKVADQTGKLLDPNVFTIVWARRFATYKRPKLITLEKDRFDAIFVNGKYPVQVIWAGKPYPKDPEGIALFNELVNFTAGYDNLAILTGYELELSGMLKKGGDLWLNNPRIPLEASGTSGMTAMMNGTPNLSTYDGWIPEFVKDMHNSFVVPAADYNNMTEEEEDIFDNKHLLDKIANDILPMYYDNPSQWNQLMFNGMSEIIPAFDADRLADDYYQKMYTF